MNESVLELVQGIFNTFLFVVSVTFSILLLNIVMQRSVSVDIAEDNRNISRKADVKDSIYTIKGSGVIDTVCKMFSDNNDIEIVVDAMVLDKDVVAGLCIGEPECILKFYELINTDKEYVVNFESDSINIGETDE